MSYNTRRASVKRSPTPVADRDHPNHEPNVQEIINIKLIESGEKERLKELLRERLIECGWKDEMKSLCRKVKVPEVAKLSMDCKASIPGLAWAFARKKGRNNVTVDDLVQVITPKGRASVPDSVKAELLQRIRSFLASAV